MSNLASQITFGALSDTVNSLDEKHRSRYITKLALIKNCDPYLLPKSMFQNALTAPLLPSITYPDIYNFLINSSSAFSHAALKSYKSLDAYKYRYFVAGFVKETLVYKNVADVFIIIGKVVHSQKLGEKPLTPWVATRREGDVICAHCNCMAGLGESCSHVAALMFAVETVVRINAGTTCTSVPCGWLAPSSSQSVPYLETHEIDFTNPGTKMRRLFHKEPIQTIQSRRKSNEWKPNYEEFYERLSAAGSRSVVLSVLPTYANEFIPKSTTLPLPEPMSKLYDPENQLLSKDELTAKCSDVFDAMKITVEQINAVEKETRGQAKSATWFCYRSGRVTASLFKAASRTSLEKPSMSLIQKICYTAAANRFSTKATRWGCEHEARVREDYTAYFSSKHENLQVTECGMFIHEDYPFIGASPDGLVSCSCCGLGLLEIKCPYCHRESTIDVATEDKNFCLETVDGQTKLKETHSYFFQVQCQLATTERLYCDFCVWSGKELFIQRIVPNEAFFLEVLTQVSSFYKSCILPELLGKYYSSQKDFASRNGVGSSGAEENTVCLCNTNDGNKTLMNCAGENCAVQVFHMECMGLKNKRKGWMCSACRVLAKRKKET